MKKKLKEVFKELNLNQQQKEYVMQLFEGYLFVGWNNIIEEGRLKVVVYDLARTIPK